MKYALIIDNHAAVRTGMKMVLNQVIPGISITEAGSFTSGLAVMKNQHFEIVILGVNFQDREKSSMIYALREISPTACILIFSGLDENKYALNFLKAGANGFLTKRSGIEEYKNAIGTLMETGKYLSFSVQQQMLYTIW